jgi:PTH1 family peptidyl-tRNA hydrolase
VHLLVGLGNPGSRYEQTRHNVGFDVVSFLSARLSIPVRDKRFGALLGSGRIDSHQVVLAMPQTWMNCSGDAVGPMAGFYRVPPAQVVVVHDELDLPFGELRVKSGGGHGGHNGLRDLSAKLGSGDYPRVRFGIGRPDVPMDPADWVLSRWSEGQRPLLPALIERAADAVVSVVREGVQAAMNRWNGPPTGKTGVGGSSPREPASARKERN